MRLTLLSLSCVVLILSNVVAANLRVGFYNSTCPKVESIVKDYVSWLVSSSPASATNFIRPFFHDCFHTGCDASFLVQHTLDGHSVEVDAASSKHVGGFYLIEDLKKEVEAECPGVVSCADVLALATRDAVALVSNNKIHYEVVTGRRDTKTVTGEGVDKDMPTANMTILAALKMFTERNFTLDEMVTLLGVHSIGFANCPSFRYRVFNYSGINGNSDPHMDAGLKKDIAKTCPSITSTEGHAMDIKTPVTLDNLYYSLLLAKKGVLEIDQQLAFDKSTVALVKSYAKNGTFFYQKFGEAMAKLGTQRVLVGDEGEIRTRCSYFNNDKRKGLPEET